MVRVGASFIIERIRFDSDSTEAIDPIDASV